MPPAPVEPERLRSLAAALAPLRECVHGGADEVLHHFPELGDRQAQTALDTYLEQVADLLREIDASTTDLANRLQVAALAAPAARDGLDPAAAPGASPATTSGW